jgi:hypothetical protein
MFARVLGPFFTIVAIIVALRAPDMRQLLSEFTASDVWPWVTGAYILMGGIAIVAFHQLWRGTAAIIVSVLGWLLVAGESFFLPSPMPSPPWPIVSSERSAYGRRYTSFLPPSVSI